MHEPSSLQRLMREWIVVRYTAALERGDLGTLSAIMERAQHDNILQLMLLEIHEAPDEESLLLLMKDKDIDMETKTGTARSMPEPEPGQQPKRPRRALWINALAAAVLICLLGGGFLGIHYWSSPHTLQTGNKGKPAALTVGHNGWCVVTTPALIPLDDSPQLSAISGDAPNDIWAVGSNAQQQDALIEHWNGQKWTAIALPELNNATSSLSDVQAIAPDDAWAVGSMQTASSGNGNVAIWPGSLNQPNGMHIEPYTAFSGGGNRDGRVLLEHWDGQKWSTVSFPHPTTWGIDGLFSVSAVSANDIWVAGIFEDRTGLASNNQMPGTYKPLLAHWDGTQWHVISSSVFPQGGTFDLVKAISANDVWVSTASGQDVSSSQLPLLHWNGSQWQVTTTIPAGFTLNSFSAASASDIWAVGNHGVDPLVMHWNGSQWNTVNLPDTHPQQVTSGSGASLNSVFAISSNDVWAVGNAVDSSGQTYYQVVVHWDGQQWKVLPPDRKDDQGQLLGVTVIAGKIWSVGIGYTDGYQEVPTTLIETSCH